MRQVRLSPALRSRGVDFQDLIAPPGRRPQDVANLFVMENSTLGGREEGRSISSRCKRVCLAVAKHGQMKTSLS